MPLAARPGEEWFPVGDRIPDIFLDHAGEFGCHDDLYVRSNLRNQRICRRIQRRRQYTLLRQAVRRRRRAAAISRPPVASSRAASCSWVSMGTPVFGEVRRAGPPVALAGVQARVLAPVAVHRRCSSR